MALKFNPFEKDKAAPTPPSKKGHYRVFDDPTRPINESVPAAPEKYGRNGSQTDHKETTNRPQTDHKQVTSKQKNGSQTDHKRTTENWKRTTQRTTQRITTRSQTDHKQTTNWDISALVGHERNLLFFVFEECRKVGELTTPPITLTRIKSELQVKSSSASKTIVARLIEKGLIQRSRSKTGRGGWMTFCVDKGIFQRLLLETDYKQITNRSQIDHKETTKQTTQRTTNAPSSSSKDLDLNKLTTTGDTNVSAELSYEWNEIDTSSLVAIRFGQHQLAQLVRVGNLTADQVQESINAFSFDLEVNGKSKEINGHALNYFMGILRKGPYAPPANYEPPKVRQMRLYLEAKERERKTREELESRLEAVEFDEWVGGLTTEERIQLVPVTDFAKPGSQGHNVQLKEYFRESIWPKRREGISSNRSVNDGDSA